MLVLMVQKMHDQSSTQSSRLAHRIGAGVDFGFAVAAATWRSSTQSG